MALFLHHQHLYESMVKSSDDAEALQAVYDGFVQAQICRWSIFGKVFDGQDGKTCASIGSNIMCDVCHEKEKRTRMREQEQGAAHWSEELVRLDQMKQKMAYLSAACITNSGDGDGDGDVDGIRKDEVEEIYRMLIMAEQQEAQLDLASPDRNMNPNQDAAATPSPLAFGGGGQGGNGGGGGGGGAVLRPIAPVAMSLDEKLFEIVSSC
jgi:hypothetical protein